MPMNKNLSEILKINENEKCSQLDIQRKLPDKNSNPSVFVINLDQMVKRFKLFQKLYPNVIVLKCQLNV